MFGAVVSFDATKGKIRWNTIRLLLTGMNQQISKSVIRSVIDHCGHRSEQSDSIISWLDQTGRSKNRKSMAFDRNESMNRSQVISYHIQKPKQPLHADSCYYHITSTKQEKYRSSTPSFLLLAMVASRLASCRQSSEYEWAEPQGILHRVVYCYTLVVDFYVNESAARWSTTLLAPMFRSCLTSRNSFQEELDGWFLSGRMPWIAWW